MALTAGFGSILSFFIRAFRYVMFCRQFMSSLAADMNELKSKRDDVNREVQRAMREGKQPKSQVQWWLNRVEALETRFNELNQQFHSRFMLPGSFAPDVWSSYLISKNADEQLAEARLLVSKGLFREVADKSLPDRFEAVPSAPTVGMDPALEQLQRLMADDDAGVIGVYGMGGVGKTALLGRFHNEFLANATDLDVIIYIDAPRDVSIETIQRYVRDRLGLSWKEKKSHKERAAILFRTLSRMKFAVIVDGLWQPFSLQAAGIPVPKQQSQCKIILSTRDEGVCDRMDASKKIKLGCLGREEAWTLFTEKVGKELVGSNPEIRHQAEVVVKKCGGLPLALIAMARALASKRTPEEWKHAVAALSNHPWQLPGIEECLLSPLKSSYDHLLNDQLRACVLHFVLHWDGCRIHKNLLQDYWIGEGIIDDFEDAEEADNKVCYLLGTLSAASLVDGVDADGYTKMHPVIRAMALWVACECGKEEKKWFVREREGLMEAPEAETWRAATRLGLGHNDIATLPDAPQCPSLVSLKLKNNMNLDTIPDGFFQFMPCLVALDLHSSPIKELPAAIGNLVTLQFLELCGTRIKSLPRELGALAKLRYLGLNWTADLQDIAGGTIARLRELRVLRMIVSYGSWRVGSYGEGVDFEELESLRRLKVLDITIGTAAALRRLSMSRRLAASTAALLIKGCRDVRTITVPSTSQFGKHITSLKWLRLSDSSELEEVVVGGGDADAEEQLALAKLENLVMENLHRAKIVWSGGGDLRNLHGLYIYSCRGMEQLIYCKDEEDEEICMTPFPNLKELALRELPELRRVSSERRTLSFPALETVELFECPKLSKLNLVARKLREIKCQRELWEQIQLSDERAKSCFMSLIKLVE